MRTALGVAILLASTSFAHAGVHVMLVDGTKMTVDSYWTDGEQTHLITGAVDLIVPKSRIASLDEYPGAPEPYATFGSGEARIDGVAPAAATDEAPAGESEPPGALGAETATAGEGDGVAAVPVEANEPIERAAATLTGARVARDRRGPDAPVVPAVERPQ